MTLPTRTQLLLVTACTLAGLISGCASRTARYRPVQASTYTRTGQPAAYYPIRVSGETLGHVKVWSPGGFPVKEGPGVVDVHLRVRNDSNAPMTVEIARTDLELTTSDGTHYVLSAPYKVTGETTVQPGLLGRVAIEYPLPSGVKAGDVNVFELNWDLQTSKGSYGDSTPFVRAPTPSPAWVYSPYWGYPGWWGPGWGWGLGFGDFDEGEQGEQGEEHREEGGRR
jgi:hypothetical protein